MTMTFHSNNIHSLKKRKNKAERKIRLLKSLYGINEEEQINRYANFSSNNFYILVTLKYIIARTNYYYFC